MLYATRAQDCNHDRSDTIHAPAVATVLHALYFVRHRQYRRVPRVRLRELRPCTGDF